MNILLLDEPLSALDRKVRAEMQYEIRNLQRQIGTTTVFVTHDQEEALTMSDQIILLHDGQIEQQGDPFTIYSQPASVFASDFLGKANLLSGVLACEDGVWCVCSEKVRIPVNHVGGREGDTVKTAVRGEYFEFCTPETEGANPFHLEKKIFTGLSWKLIGTLGTQPLDISALGTHAGTLSEGDDLFVRIRRRTWSTTAITDLPLTSEFLHGKPVRSRPRHIRRLGRGHRKKRWWKMDTIPVSISCALLDDLTGFGDFDARTDWRHRRYGQRPRQTEKRGGILRLDKKCLARPGCEASALHARCIRSQTA